MRGVRRCFEGHGRPRVGGICRHQRSPGSVRARDQTVTATSASGGYLAPSSALPLEDGAFDAVLQGFVVGVTALAGNLVRPRWQPIPPPTPDPTVNWCAIGVVVEDPAEGKGFITHDGSDNGGLGSDTLQVNDE